MLHYGRNKYMLAITYCISLTFKSVIKKTVDKDRSVRRYAYGSRHINLHMLIIMNDLHSAASENIRRTNHYGITDLPCALKCLFHIYCHSRLRHRNIKLIHHLPEQIPVFGKIYGLRCCSENVHAVFFKVRCQIKRSLPAELRNDSKRLFLFIYA